MSDTSLSHHHAFLGDTHASSERKTWAVIWLCGIMMILEIVGGLVFGSIALVADGLHMSTHAGALLLAALAYTYARKHADDPLFTFGTGKLGDLAGFASAIILAMIAILIGYEAVGRLFAPVAIDFREAIPIACLGLVVNIASAWLLSSGGHHHHGSGHGRAHEHSHGHDHGSHDHEREGMHRISTATDSYDLKLFEDGVPPRFRLYPVQGSIERALGATVETRRLNGTMKTFAMTDRGGYLESIDAIPEPHAFTADVRIGQETHRFLFEEHAATHDRSDAKDVVHRDNNMRAAIVHVVADAAVSVLVIVGLLLARAFGWMWMDPVAGLIGAVVIASWSYGLIRDAGAILLDMNPEPNLAKVLRRTIEDEGDRIADLHLWRLGPGHLGAIVSIVTSSAREGRDYRDRLASFKSLSHLTIEVTRA